MEQCIEEVTSPCSYIALPWGVQPTHWRRNGLTTQAAGRDFSFAWPLAQCTLYACAIDATLPCSSSSNCALLLYLPLMHDEMQPEDIHSLPQTTAEVAEASWGYCCHTGEQNKQGLPWGLGLPTLHRPTCSAISTAFHSPGLLQCFPFLFEEACLILLTTLNEDKAHVCNNRLKLNFKQIIC